MSTLSILVTTLFFAAGVVGALDLANTIAKRKRITASMLPRIVGDAAWCFVTLTMIAMFATGDYRTYPPLIASAAWLGIGSWVLYLIDRLVSGRYCTES